MYDNIGGKIKGFSIINAVIGTVVCFVLGFSVMNSNTVTGLLIIILGSISSWINSVFLYGFGVLVENSDENLIIQKRILNTLNHSSQKTQQLLLESNKKDTGTTVAENTDQPKVKTEHKWRCDHCGSIRSQSPCPYCGKE